MTQQPSPAAEKREGPLATVERTLFMTVMGEFLNAYTCNAYRYVIHLKEDAR